MAKHCTSQHSSCGDDTLQKSTMHSNLLKDNALVPSLNTKLSRLGVHGNMVVLELCMIRQKEEGRRKKKKQRPNVVEQKKDSFFACELKEASIE